jgi:hypothetical protein
VTNVLSPHGVARRACRCLATASGGLSVGVVPQHPSIVPGRQSPNRLASGLVWEPESPGALKLRYSLQTTSKLMPTSDQCHVARLTVSWIKSPLTLDPHDFLSGDIHI